MPISFGVGETNAPFGEDLRRLTGPHYERGYLPIVQLAYRADDHSTPAPATPTGSLYTQEVFASVDWPSNAVVFVQFRLPTGKQGVVTARLETNAPLTVASNTVSDAHGNTLVAYDRAWQWNEAQRTLTARLSEGGKATLAIATVPVNSATQPALQAADFDAEKQKCLARWEAVVAGAMRVEVPEPVVNAAAKATLIGNFLLLAGDRMNYSAGNLYQTMYEAESGDAVRALALWGVPDSRRMIPVLLDYGTNPGLRFHDAAFKLQLLAHYYWLTRDASGVRELKPRWRPALEILTRERDAATGLLPREAYCGDEHDRVFSLNVNANACAGCGDRRPFWKDLGDPAESPTHPRHRRRVAPGGARRGGEKRAARHAAAVYSHRAVWRGDAIRDPHRHAPGQLLEFDDPLRDRLGHFQRFGARGVAVALSGGPRRDLHGDDPVCATFPTFRQRGRVG